MAQKISVGIDIGTRHIKVAITEHAVLEDGTFAPRLLGLGSAESKGLRHGHITNIPEVTRAVRSAIGQAEKAAKIKIKKAYISIGGVGLGSVTGKASVMVSKADSEITSLDIKNVLETAESELAPAALMNKKIIFTIPLSYKIDDQPVVGRPLGMHGTKLEAKVLFIVCLDQHLNDLIRATEDAGVDVIDVMASPIAAGIVSMTKSQKVAGGVLVNIGAETVSTAVFENNIPISLEVFPVGSTDITNDLALGLRIPIDEAEKVKHGASTDSTYPKKKVEDMAAKRLGHFFDLVEGHLKKIGRSGLLPAGAMLTGGGSLIANIEDIAKSALRLPAKTVAAALPAGIKSPLKDASWTVAYGLSVWGLHSDDEITDGLDLASGRSGKIFRGVGDWFKQFLP